MEKTLKFNSQIATSRVQSERLLSLGLKKETADMVLLKEMVYDEENHCTRDGDNYLIRPIDYLEGEEHRGHIPAWSLHRLIEIMPQSIHFENEDWYKIIYNNSMCYQRGRFSICRSCKSDLYVDIINCIEWLIKEGYFNNEYLV